MDNIIGLVGNITVGQLATSLTVILVLVSAFIEITPIKINPISSFLQWVGDKTGARMIQRLDHLEKDVKDLSTKVDSMEAANDKRNAVACRVRIIRFGDECRIGSDHSQEAFEQVLEDINVYDRYCANHPEFKNHKTVTTSKIIIDLYEERFLKNDFV